MDESITEKIVKDALEHDRKLNDEEIKIVEEINKVINDIEYSMNDFKTLLEKIKAFDYAELKSPLPKDEEYKLFFDIIKKYNEISRNTQVILEKLLTYKELLDKELY